MAAQQSKKAKDLTAEQFTEEKEIIMPEEETKKPKTAKGEPAVEDYNVEINRESLKADVKKILAELDGLETRTKELQSKAMISTLEPTGNYIFAKQVIDNDLRGLEETYKGLRNLVIAIQARQEQTYNELVKANNQVTEMIGSVQSELSSSINTVQSELGNSISNLQSDLSTSINNTQVDLSGQINGVQVELTNTINNKTNDLTQAQNKSAGELKSDIDRLKADLSRQVNKLNTELQGLKSNKESSLRILAQYVRKLAAATAKSEELSKFGLDSTMQKLENTGLL